MSTYVQQCKLTSPSLDFFYNLFVNFLAVTNTKYKLDKETK